MIELLAVIVILAIIATIAVPIVLNIIEDTKNSATLMSADFYLDAVELSLLNEEMNKKIIEDGTYNILENGNICLVYDDLVCIDELEVTGSGKKPTSGKITIEDGKIKSIYKLTLDNKKISIDQNGNLAIKKYSTYTITYENIDDTTGLITSVEEGETLKVDLTGKEELFPILKVKIDDELITDYTFEDSVLKILNVNGDVTIIGGETFVVSYSNFDDVSGLPTKVVEGTNLTVDFTGKNYGSSALSVQLDSVEITDYIYDNNILTVSNVSGNITIIGPEKYTVTYNNLTDLTGLPTIAAEGANLVLDLTNKNKNSSTITVKVGTSTLKTSYYTYSNNILTIPKERITGNVTITGPNTYTITYNNLSDVNDLPTTATQGLDISFDLTDKNKNPNILTVMVGTTTLATSAYTYVDNILTIPKAKVTGNITITGADTLTVGYNNIDNISSFPVSIVEGNQLEIDLSGKGIDSNKLKVQSNGVGITNYTYLNNVLTIPNVSGDITIINFNNKCVAVNNNTKTTGNVPTGAYNIGDEYICQVNDIDTFRFFVLSTETVNETTKVNLIMDRNLTSDGTVATSTNKGLVAWVSKADYNDDANYGTTGNSDKGPITVMNYLYAATDEWTNIDNIYVNYNDSKWGKIVTEDNVTKIYKLDNETVTTSYENLKARLPIGVELKVKDSTNLWMYNYTSSAIRGYWSYYARTGGISSRIYEIDYRGYIGHENVSYSNYGIRPVIQLNTSSLG